MTAHSVAQVAAENNVARANQRIEPRNQLQRGKLASPKRFAIDRIVDAASVVRFNRTAYEHRGWHRGHSGSEVRRERRQPIALDDHMVELARAPEQIREHRSCEGGSRRGTYDSLDPAGRRMIDFGAAFDFARQDRKLEVLCHSLDHPHVGPALHDEADTYRMRRRIINRECRRPLGGFAAGRATWNGAGFDQLLRPLRIAGTRHWFACACPKFRNGESLTGKAARGQEPKFDLRPAPSLRSHAAASVD